MRSAQSRAPAHKVLTAGSCMHTLHTHASTQTCQPHVRRDPPVRTVLTPGRCLWPCAHRKSVTHANPAKTTPRYHTHFEAATPLLALISWPALTYAREKHLPAIPACSRPRCVRVQGVPGSVHAACLPHHQRLHSSTRTQARSSSRHCLLPHLPPAAPHLHPPRPRSSLPPPAPGLR